MPLKTVCKNDNIYSALYTANLHMMTKKPWQEKNKLQVMTKKPRQEKSKLHAVTKKPW